MKAWLICVLCVSAFSGLTDILIPNGKSKKTFKAVSVIVLLCVLLYPLKNIDRNFYFYKFSFSNKEVSSSFQENYDEAVIAAYESGIKHVLTEQLSDFAITADRISIVCEATADKIRIKRIRVFVENNDKTQNEKIKAVINECLEEKTEIEIISR
ncbi:MAG: stage III sporulation protein AF [Oscillospiraceae bacterium]|nr:stage III sporulation protein AF [Oscillospiraceae bacterium]